MTGDILYPLNVLKEKYPEIYAVHASKYNDRQDLLNLVIPSLNCLWNDALHFSAIHPKEIKDALLEAGVKKELKITCYEINPELLEPEKTIVYLYDQTPSIDMVSEKNFTTYNPHDLEKYSHLPEETKNYYKEMVVQNKNPLAMHKTVHILYKGNIDIENAPIVEA